MNNTEDTFADAQIRPDVDRDRLLTQIAQGLLTAHARLDLMEERLVQATSHAVVNHLQNGLKTLKDTEKMAMDQVKALNGVEDRIKIASEVITDKHLNNAIAVLKSNQQELRKVMDTLDDCVVEELEAGVKSLNDTEKIVREQINSVKGLEDRLKRTAERMAENLLASAISTMKDNLLTLQSNKELYSQQLQELKRILRILEDAEDNFSKAATQAIEGQINTLLDSHVALRREFSTLRSDSNSEQYVLRQQLNKTEQEITHHLAATRTNIKTQADDHAKALDEKIKDLQRKLVSSLSEMQGTLSGAMQAVDKRQNESLSNAQHSIESNIGKVSSMLNETQIAVKEVRDINNIQFRRQVVLIVVCFVSFVVVLVANKFDSGSGYYILAAVLCSAVIIVAGWMMHDTKNGVRKQNTDQDAPALQKQRNSL